MGDNEVNHTRHLEHLIGRMHLGRTQQCDTASAGDTVQTIPHLAPSTTHHRAQESLLACAARAMRAHNVSTADWLLAGSSTLSGFIGQSGADADVLLRPSARSKVVRLGGRAVIVAPSVQVITGAWLGGNGSALSDSSLLDAPRWHAWTTGDAQRVKHTRTELTLLKMCGSSRSKDREKLAALWRRPLALDVDTIKAAVAVDALRERAHRGAAQPLCDMLLRTAALQSPPLGR